MSTILQALEKGKFDRATASSPVIPLSNKLLQWRVAISSALFIIIMLLGTVVYLLLYPPSQIQTPVVAASQLSVTPINNRIIKVNFDTQPLPENTFKPKQVIVVAKKMPVVQKQPPKKIVQEEKNIQIEQTDKTVEYDDVSSDLKRRFELALLMTDMENNESSIEDIEKQAQLDDGSDIRDMNSEFQRKVPPIRYDSHMYSSQLEDRWIRINGEILIEGEFDSTGQLELIEIQPQRSIFRLKRQSFSIESLTDWKGY